MSQFVIHDTADVTIKHKSTGKVVLNTVAQLASISGAISEEDLRGGIGNKKLYKIRTDKDINLNVRSAFGDMEYWAMVQGATVENNGTVAVTKNSKAVVSEAPNTATTFAPTTAYSLGDFVKPTVANGFIYEVTSAGTSDLTEPTWVTTAGSTVASDTVIFTARAIQLELASLPTGVTEITIVDKNGEQDVVPVVAGKATLPLGSVAVAGDELKFFYKEEITGRKITVEADKFAEKYEVEYRTISYNPETAEIYSNIYFVFPDVIPVGEFEISLENGTVYTPEIGFSVMTPIDSNVYAEIIEELV